MNLQRRIELLTGLGEYMLTNDNTWQAVKERAGRENPWFIPEFVELATHNIAASFLQKKLLEDWRRLYNVPEENKQQKKIGIVMAGNIPLVGFHDLLCVFISGHIAVIKPSSKDKVLIQHLAGKLAEWEPEVNELIIFADLLKGCDAYIATGSNNTAGYFDYYFSKYPHIIRRNRTSVALLNGDESAEDLELLADDVYQFFGLGCRNVTKIYVPSNFDFKPLLNAFRKYNYLADHHKYKNNYDYNLALLILNKKEYMSNESILLAEESSFFSPISQLHYEYYEDVEALKQQLKASPELQCLVGKTDTKPGGAQNPFLYDYADGVDTMRFLMNL